MAENKKSKKTTKNITKTSANATSKFLKQFLTTASMLTLVTAGTIEHAAAGAAVATTAAAALNSSANWNDITANAAAAVPDPDATLTIAHDLSVGADLNVGTSNFKLDVTANKTFTIGHVVHINDVTSNGGVLTVAANEDGLNLVGTSYDGFNIAVANAKKVVFSVAGAAATFNSTIDGAAAGKGQLDILRTAGVTFSQAIGGAYGLENIYVGTGGGAHGKAIFEDNVNAANITFNTADSSMTVSSNRVITGNLVSNGAPGNGELIIAHGGDGGSVTGSVGNANAIKSITSNHTSGTFTFDPDVSAQTITVANAGALTFADNLTGATKFSADGILNLVGSKTITGAIDNTTGAANAGTINIAAGNAGKVTGIVGGTHAVKVIKSNLADANHAFTFDSAVKAQEVEIAGLGALTFSDNLTGATKFSADGILNLVGSKTITGAIDNTTGAANAGTINIAAGNTGGSVSGLVGDSNSLKVIKSNLADATHKFTFAETVKAATVDIAHDGILAFTKNLTGAVSFSAEDGVLALTGNSVLTGAVTAHADNKGTITIAAGTDGKVTGLVGDNGTALKLITSNVDTAGNTFTFESAVHATNINITSAGTLKFDSTVNGAIKFTAGDGVLTLAGDKRVTGAITTHTAGNGSITIGAGDVGKVTGLVGGPGAALKKITSNVVNANHTFTFDAAVTSPVTIAGAGALAFADDLTGAVNFTADGIVRFTAAGKTLTGDVTTSANETGTLDIDHNTTVTGVIGATAAKLKDVNVAGANTLTVNAAGTHYSTKWTAGNAAATFKFIDLANATGNFVANANGNGVLTLEGSSNITGNIGTNAAKWTKIEAGVLNKTAHITGDVNVSAGGIEFSGAGTIKLEGNASTTDNTTNLVNFAGNDGTLVIVGPSELTGTIISGADDTGKISITGAAGGKTSGKLGEVNTLKSLTLNLDDAADVFTIENAANSNGFAGDVTVTKGILDITTADTKLVANAFNIAADGTLKLSAANSLDDAAVLGAGNAGTLQVNEDNTLLQTWALAKTINIADTKKLTLSAAADAAFSTANQVINLEGADSKLILKTAGGAKSFTLTETTFKRAYADGNNTDLNGIIELDSTGGTLTVAEVANKDLGDSATNRLQKLVATGGNDVTVALPVYAKNIETALGAAADKTLTFSKEVNSGAESELKFTDHTKASTVSFAADATITNIDLAGAVEHIVKVTTATFTGNIKNSANANGTVHLVGANANIVGNIGDGDRALTEVKFAGAGAGNAQKITGNVFATTTKFYSETTAEVTGNITGAVDFNNQDDAVLTLSGENAKITGLVDAGAGANGTLKFTNANNITSEIGGVVGNANALTELSTVGALKLSGVGDNKATTFKLAGAAAKFQIATGANLTGNVTTTTTDKGTIEFLGNSTFAGDIGANAMAVAKIQLSGVVGTALTFTPANANALYAKELAIGAATAKFNKDAAVIRLEEFSHSANAGVIELAQNTTIEKLSEAGATLNLGTTDSKLATLALADKTLTLGKGVNLHTATLTNTPDNGGVRFAGDSDFSFTTQNAALKTVTLSDVANVTNKISGPLKVQDDGIVFRQASTLELNNNLTLSGNGTINFATKAATLKFTNSTAITVDANANVFAADAGNATVEFAGSDVTFAKTTGVAASEYKFTNDATDSVTTVTFSKGEDGTKAGGSKFTNISTKNAHIVKFSESSSLDNIVTGKVQFKIADGEMLTVGGAATLADATLSSSTAGTGDINLEKANLTVSQIGTSETHRVNTLTISNDAAITKAIYAKQAEVIAAKSLSVKGTVNLSETQGIKLNAGSTLTLVADGDNETILATKVTAPDGSGTVAINSNAHLKDYLGTSIAKLASVTFAADKSYKIDGSIYSGNTILNNASYTFNKALTLGGSTDIRSGAHLDIGAQTVTIADALTIAGESTVALALTNAGANGKLTVTTPSTIEAGTQITFDLSGTASFGKEYHVVDATFTEENIARLAAVTKSSGTNTYVEYRAGVDETGVKISTHDRSRAAIAEKFAASGASLSSEIQDFVSGMMGASEGTDGAATADVIKTLEAKKTVELLDRMSAASKDSSSAASSSVSNIVSSRMASLSPSSSGGARSVEVSSADTGISAGDDDSRHGVWGTPFFGNSTQKQNNKDSGYKADTYGVTLGIDSKVNEDVTVGVALSTIHTSMKFKDVKKGDTMKSDSYIFSVYGGNRITNNWFIQTAASFGNNNVINQQQRVTGPNSYGIATAKYSSMMFSGEVVAGYQYGTDSVTFTPTAGLRISRTNDSGYKESGSTSQNLVVSKKAHNKFEVIGGLQVSTAPLNIGEAPVTPEVHAFVGHDLIGKSPKSDVRLNGVANSLGKAPSKPAKTYYNIGAGLTTNYGMMEYGVGYDANISRKFVSHQGTLKVRVNF